MLPGTPALPAVAPHRTALVPIGTAIAAYIVAIGIGTGLGVFSHASSATAIAELQAAPSGWEVNDGTIGITVKQLGSDVQGEFAEWVAAIEFSETATDGSHGTAEVTIAIGSLTLGSVTGQAMGADYFDAAGFPTATFTATLIPDGDGYAADGTLTLKGATIPVRFPFDLTIEGDTATMSAQTTLARLDYDIGANQNESSLGLSVIVDIALTATRTDG
jgi:polyisoprenoid-binding protein YceI